MRRFTSLPMLLLLVLTATQSSASSRIRLEDQTVTANESDGHVLVTVRRSDDEGAVSVDYSTVPISATEGADYVPASGTLSWPDGDDEDRIITVVLVDDSEDETTESFELVLSNPTGGATIDEDRSQTIVFVADDDAAGVTPTKPGILKFADRRVSTRETAGFATLRVERSKGQDGPISVQFLTTEGTATAPDDFQATSGSLAWGDGDSTERVITIPLVDDGPGEGLESFEVELLNPTGGAALDSLQRTALVTLVGDAPGGPGAGTAGSLRFDTSNFQASESAVAAVITVDRHDGSSGQVAVSYSMAGETATEGEDFELASGMLSWNDGDSSTKSFMVPLIDDTLEEGSETVRLLLSGPAGGAEIDEGRAAAILTILDDDAGRAQHPGGRLRFTRDTFSATEGSGGAQILVQRQAGNEGFVSARIRTVGGSATADEDFEPVDSLVTWGDGESGIKSVTVPLLDDMEQEPIESVALELHNGSAGVLVEASGASARLEIVDDDVPAPGRCEISPFTLCLQQGRFQIEVVWRAPNGDTGKGETRALSSESGIVWFFDEENVEMLIKALDACEPFDSYWIFFAATTNLDFTVFVTDTQTGLQKEYSNLLGVPALPVQDTETFRGCSGDSPQ